MNTNTERTAAHIVRQHRAGFIAGVDFEDDSRLIEWPDSCAREGATEPVDYTTGASAQADDQLFRRVLLVVAVFALAVVGFVIPMGPAS